jgi:hypothetical protein
MPGKRARADQFAERVNAAAALLVDGADVPSATRQIARRHQLSQRQARRYVERARDHGTLKVPRPARVFTVRIPVALIRALKEYARVEGHTLSAIVSQALEELMGLTRAGTRGGR